MSSSRIASENYIQDKGLIYETKKKERNKKLDEIVWIGEYVNIYVNQWTKNVPKV